MIPIWIPTNSDDDGYNTNTIPRRQSSWRSLFWYNFDLIYIKVDPFQCNFDWNIDQSRLRDWKSWLKDQKYHLEDQKYWFIDRNCQFILKNSIYFDVFDVYRSLSISFWLKSIDFDHFDILRTHFKSILLWRFGFGRWIWIEKVD